MSKSGELHPKAWVIPLQRNRKIRQWRSPPWFYPGARPRVRLLTPFRIVFMTPLEKSVHSMLEGKLVSTAAKGVLRHRIAAPKLSKFIDFSIK